MPEMWQGCLHLNFLMILMHVPEEKKVQGPINEGHDARAPPTPTPPATPPLSSGSGLGATEIWC